MQKSILESIMKLTESNKRQQDLQNSMCHKLKEDTIENQRLQSDIKNLQSILDKESEKLEEMDRYFSEELKQEKLNEQQIVRDFENNQDKIQEIEDRLQTEQNRKIELSKDIEIIKRENQMLKNELKRLGQRTSEKILECESNINQMNRMKEFHKDNFLMEKEKLQNSSDFVIEQLKITYDDRKEKQEKEMSKINIEKKNIFQDLENLANELRQFNYIADQRIKEEMNVIIEEEENKQYIQVKEIEDKIIEEDQQIEKINQDNHRLLQNLQQQEHQFKNKLLSIKNQNSRLKEEYNRIEDEDNKIKVKLNTESKQNELYNQDIQQLQEEIQEIQQKEQILQQNYEEELQLVKEQQDKELQLIQNEYNDMQQKEQQYIKEIQEWNNKLQNLNVQHNEQVLQLQNKLNSTLNVQKQII